jgi:NAD-dependent dihydropyrimidine dehydrogenase PreA subunit
VSARPAGVPDLAREVLLTLLRLFPWSTEPGLRRAGNPGPSSPVLVTGNYDLTVRRLLRALEGVDAWVVVAPSRGINVWCAAAGGHLTSHQVVTALKTSGVEECVEHRRAILPQLAATGVMAREVSRRCGWKVRFGPVYAEDLPRYLAQREQKSEDMRRVRFGVAERLEMAVAWAGPTSLVIAALAALFRPAWCLPVILLSWALAVAVFLVYDRVPGPRRLLLAGGAIAVSLGLVALAGGGAAALSAAAIACVLLTAILTYDYSGSTPIEGGSHFDERHWHITLDRERCQGIHSCWEVCPKACFEKSSPEAPGTGRKVDLAHPEHCISCGACVVQCGQDALYFEDEKGQRVEPDTIRRFKLNLMGRRAVASADANPTDGDPPRDSAS